MLYSIASWILALPVAAYIRAHRAGLADRGTPIAAEDRRRLAGYFSEDMLDAVRIVEQDPLPIAEPPLVHAVRWMGFRVPDIREIEAITFDHVIAARSAMPATTLFHELVHVAQYRELRVLRFSVQYVRGLLESRSYEGIPLEMEAYRLERRFARGESGFRVRG